MDNKKSYWRYVKDNTPIFFYLWLGVVGFFMLYWIVFQTGYQRELVWTLTGIGVLCTVMLTIWFFKWRKL